MPLVNVSVAEPLVVATAAAYGAGCGSAQDPGPSAFTVTKVGATRSTGRRRATTSNDPMPDNPSTRASVAAGAGSGGLVAWSAA